MKTVFTNEGAVQAFGEGNGQARNSSGSIFAEGDTLYSYGYHFVLAIRLENGLYLINADTYSVTTSKQTNLCIHNLTPNVQIPFSALRGARIDPKTVKVIDNKADTWVTETYKNDKGEEVEHEVHHLGGVLLEAKGNQYASGFDTQESWDRHAYFLTHLNGSFDTFDEAIEGLKPERVKSAIASGQDVKRQGEWFFLKTEFSPKQIKNFTVKVGRVHPIVPESTHLATEVREVFNPDRKKYGHIDYVGARIVKGVIRHVRNEHRTLKLGDDWYIPVKNTAIENFVARGNVD